MPKEQINYVNLDPRSDNDPGGTGDVAVYVQWLPEQAEVVYFDGGGVSHSSALEHDGWVQVGFEVDVAYAQRVADTPNGRNDRRTYVYSPVLHRRDVNKLIKTLKKARDRAYGAEED